MGEHSAELGERLDSVEDARRSIAVPVTNVKDPGRRSVVRRAQVWTWT